jgi:hypothetical protein
MQPFFISGIDVRNRMSLMRLKGGKYLAYGLVMPTPDCVKKVRSTGRVTVHQQALGSQGRA